MPFSRLLAKFPLLKKLSGYLYPPLCFHCHSLVKKQNSPLCLFCLEQLETIPPEPREERYLYYRMGLKELEGAFFHEGPIISLLHAFKNTSAVFLAEPLSAFLALQWGRLNWPYPDVLIPIPPSPFRVLKLGYDPSLLLAESLGKILQKPVCIGLKKEWGHPPQSVLDRENRKSLSKQIFTYRAKQSLQGKTVLLVDDMIGTGATMRASSLTLRTGFPKAVYGIAVSRWV